MSVTLAPRARMAVNAHGRGVDERDRAILATDLGVDLIGPDVLVMPASPATTSADRIASSSFVFRGRHGPSR